MDDDAARAVAGLADASLTETDAVKFVQTRCRELLQPRFEVRKLKNALAEHSPSNRCPSHPASWSAMART